jgi:hypothetical protein
MAAVKRIAADLTLNLKPNINDYSCTCWALAMVEPEVGRRSDKNLGPPLIRTSTAVL